MDCQECRGRGEVDVYRCPSSQGDDLARMIVRCWENNERGILPFDGVGWAEMPRVALTMMDLVASEHAKILAAQAQRAPA